MAKRLLTHAEYAEEVFVNGRNCANCVRFARFYTPLGSIEDSPPSEDNVMEVEYWSCEVNGIVEIRKASHNRIPDNLTFDHKCRKYIPLNITSVTKPHIFLKLPSATSLLYRNKTYLRRYIFDAVYRARPYFQEGNISEHYIRTVAKHLLNFAEVFTKYR